MDKRDMEARYDSSQKQIRLNVSSGGPFEDQVGYSRAVRIGDQIAVSGCAAILKDGTPVGEGDAYAQARQCLRTLTEALAKAGVAKPDVIRTRIYVVDIDRDLAAVARAHEEVFGEIRPATTMVQVAALIRPWMLVEIEADAVVKYDSKLLWMD
eukprot:SM000051S17558  [mRNA]  locus=s51:380347:380993:- [translate_table: standard]